LAIKKRTQFVKYLETRQIASEKNRRGLERLIFFNDAVFAIAITLLALEIRLPSNAQVFSNGDLLTGLVALTPKFLAYLISFLVIGSFWIGHHRKFRYIKRYDGRLMTLNMFILLMVAFIPFPSSVISENGSLTATVFYAMTMILIGIFYFALWWYASRRRNLIDPDLSVQQRRREFINPLLFSLVFLISIGIAFFSPYLARIAWLLILPVSPVMNRG
jgi:uncharacterized membrane protein